MMKKPIASLLVLGLMAAAPALYADNSCSSIFGNTSCDNVNMPSLQVTNSAKLNRTNIQQAVNVGGNFKSVQSTLGSLQVRGNADIDQTTVLGAASVGGDFHASNSLLSSLTVQGRTDLEHATLQQTSTLTGDFKADASRINNVTLYSSKAMLNDASAGKITLKTANAVLCLVGNSDVGNVHFTSGGTVYRASGTKVGQVSGGKTVMGACPFTA